ncbi:ComEA family DNA-binding protein [Rhodohalobacter halophilus]|uniref:ComEA family DNA-binding protein n=1 Tax=Rhodohalobacter halophilus TaxID=1812810 RepID=UPI00159F2820|nr:helix-hairpin-helix domain-containing protein [Rhodohalobacter halophilus]
MFILTPNSYAQHQDSTQSKIEHDLEILLDEFDGEESDTTLEELLEFLQNLAANPLNINRAGLDELLQVPGINFRIAQNIVQYRSSNPPFEKVDDLTSVSGIGSATLSQIQPYLTVGTAAERGRDLYLNPRYWTGGSRLELFSRMQQTIEEQRGYQRPDTLGGFTGSPIKYYQRVRYRSNHLSLNLTQEKDPGEPLNYPMNFDYNSWHLALENNGRLNSLIIGDYSVSFGQGLLLWSGGAFGKGSEVIRTPIKNERGIRPFTSAQEMIGFRGVAATYGNRLQLTGFYSNRKRTASEIDESTIRFPTENGLHRTLNERSRRLNTTQKSYGGRVRYRLPVGFIGVSGFHNRFDRPVQRGTLPWELNNFDGASVTGYAADIRILAGPATLFGEAAHTDNNSYGFLVGAQFELSDRTDAIMLYRRYDPDFRAIFGSGFGEQSGNPRNEQGLYIGLQHQVSPAIRISTYIDQFQFPAPRFQQRQPSSGYDWLARVDLSPGNRFRFYALIRFKQREEDHRITDELGRDVLAQGESKRTGVRFQAEYIPLQAIRFRTRFDTVRSRSAGESSDFGYLLFQDVRFYLFQNLRIDARYTYFNTDGFDSRVYQFENDLLYVLSNTMLFDRGKRIYALVNFSPAPWIDVWLKASTTVYDNRETISSGNLQIDGNRKSDIGVQARIRF